jgi:hypothetical protein
MDEFVENLVKLGGLMAVVGLPLGLILVISSPDQPGGSIALGAGVIGLAIYFIASYLDDKAH